MSESEVIIRRPDDWHLHLRDGAILRAVAPHTSAHFARAIVMPNLVPPVATSARAETYREEILAAVPAAHDFEPLMTLYLTEETDADDLAAGARSGLIKGVKLYPAGATTNSDAGVRDLARVTGVLERMAEIGLPLLVHGEVVDPEVDVFDREARFIEQVLAPLRERLPKLKVVLEHVTTAEGIDFVAEGEGDIAATLTVHHLIINRNAMFKGGIRPHYYCLPVAKRERHRLALRAAATSGSPRFFLGTDSAPHTDARKETACGCAGLFTVTNALSCLTHVFEEEGALDKLEGFASLHGPAFYGLPANEKRVRLVKRDQPLDLPAKLETPEGPITVFDPGFPLHWAVEG